ncbi:MAG: hypothetical protein ACI88U_001906, partial [Porticoccaceae bacterium]
PIHTSRLFFVLALPDSLRLSLMIHFRLQTSGVFYCLGFSASSLTAKLLAER